MICLEAKTGKACQGFGTNGVVNLRAGVADEFPELEYAVTSPPAIYKDLLITGAAVPEYPSRGPSGAVRAFDVHSGKLVWTSLNLEKQDTKFGKKKRGRVERAQMCGRR